MPSGFRPSPTPDRAARRPAALLAGALLAAALGSACKQEDYRDGLVLEITMPAGGDLSRPDFLELDWLNAGRGIFEKRRIPESGSLSAGGSYLATIVIDLDANEAAVVRRAVVRGAISGDRLLIGWRRFEASPGIRVPLALSVIAMKDLPTIDADDDGVPDAIDACPGAKDFLGCSVDARAASADSASADARGAGSQDGPASPQDASDAPTDASPRMDGGQADAGLDASSDRPSQGAIEPPTAPSMLRVVSTKSTEIQLAWADQSSNETGFVVERIIAGSFKQVGMVGANTTTFTDRGLQANTPYTYQVVAVRETARSVATPPVSVTTGP